MLLKLLKNDNPAVLTKVPTLKTIENWIVEAKKLADVPKKGEKKMKKVAQHLCQICK